MEVTLRGFRLAPFGCRFLSHSQSVNVRAGYGERRNETRTNKQNASSILENEENGVFRVLDIGRGPSTERRDDQNRRVFSKMGPPRHAEMLPDQEWANVWPAARTFHPAVVPLPVRQGVPLNKTKVTPSKYANSELMKIPNFLHLTPPVVRRHCAAIKKFCNPWPTGLHTDEDVEKHFPVEVITSDYLNSSSSIRDRRSRVVVLKFKLSSLELAEHSRDKCIRLLGERYDHATDIVTLASDRCPYRGQNIDYTRYLVTALYFESCKVESWETKEHLDVERYAVPAEVQGDEADYQQALQQILNGGEDEDSLRAYKAAARKLLQLPPETVDAVVVDA